MKFASAFFVEGLRDCGRWSRPGLQWRCADGQVALQSLRVNCLYYKSILELARLTLLLVHQLAEGLASEAGADCRAAVGQLRCLHDDP